MSERRGGFLRDNAFVVAAVALPVVVTAFFLVASVVPRWMVPPPAYDLILRVARPYDAAPGKVLVDFGVRGDRVVATIRPAPAGGYAQPWALLAFDHETLGVREVSVDLPVELEEGEASRVIVIEALAGTRVSAQSVAPDGYALQSRTSGSTGLVGDLFGMGRYRQRAALVRGGRVVAITLPSPYQDPYQSPVYAVGWVLDEGR